MSECPKCHEDFFGEKIYDTLKKFYPEMTESELVKSCHMYGDFNLDRRFDTRIGIETDQYDGISWWQCSKCRAIFKRFPWADEKYLMADQRKHIHSGGI